MFSVYICGVLFFGVGMGYAVKISVDPWLIFSQILLFAFTFFLGVGISVCSACRVDHAGYMYSHSD
jgi:hypothetical protein